MDGLSLLNSQYPATNAQQCVIGGQALEGSLKKYQSKLETVKFEQSQLYTTVLDDTLEQLLGLVDFVSESDSDLLVRARQGQYTSPTALRQSLVEIFQRSQQVTTQFNQTIDKFTEGLDTVKSFDAEVAHFSITVVSRIQHNIEGVIQRCEEDINKANNAIVVVNAKAHATQKEIEQLQRNIDQARHKEDRHKVARNVLIGTSVVGGLGVAGTIGLLIFCPPAGVGAALALGYGGLGSAGVTTGAAIVAKENDDDVDRQRERQAEFRGDQNAQQAQLRMLESEKTDKQNDLQRYKTDLELIPKIKSQLREVQAGFQQIRNELFERRTVFTNTRMRLEGSRSELEMCQFSRTRQHLAEALEASLQSLTSGGYGGRREVTIVQLREGILGISSRTSQLWNSLDPRVQQGL